jgi:hypothetical protein
MATDDGAPDTECTEQPLSETEQLTAWLQSEEEDSDADGAQDPGDDRTE